jgi:hypothetical protein
LKGNYDCFSSDCRHLKRGAVGLALLGSTAHSFAVQTGGIRDVNSNMAVRHKGIQNFIKIEE